MWLLFTHCVCVVATGFTWRFHTAISSLILFLFLILILLLPAKISNYFTFSPRGSPTTTSCRSTNSWTIAASGELMWTVFDGF